MSNDKKALISQRNAVKRALAAKLAARRVRNGGRDGSQHRTQKD
jgi:hypothetical protein